jgi:predicted phage terminase large subunit-like protein
MQSLEQLLIPPERLERLAQRAEARLTYREGERRRTDWLGLHGPALARHDQHIPEGNWRTWLILAGRGWGKTRTGAEAIRKKIGEGVSRIALVAPTAADVRDVMVEGESGLLAIYPEWERPLYEPSKRRLTWPNGAVATTYSADEPDRLRGPQHEWAWADEIAAWQYPETWDMLMLGLRLGDDPRCIATTTPKPKGWLRDLMRAKTTHITRGRTWDNKSNLAPAFIEQIIAKYEGSRLGRQEIEGEYLADMPGALWARTQIDNTRVAEAPDLRRLIIAIDPAATSQENSDESGIIAAGMGHNKHGYLLRDMSMRDTPKSVCERAVAAYWQLKADCIVAEVNNGGEWIEAVLKAVDPTVPFKAVHASRGKVTRAEPVSAQYERGYVHHVGSFPQLEDQMCEFTVDFDRKAAGYSPDRLDAMVWAFTDLMLGGSEPRILAL